MGQISLQPEFVTNSGEASSILVNNQYVGTMTLLYREEDRVWGSVQLDEEMLHADEKEEIDLYLHQYVQHMIDAVGAEDCVVSFTYSHMDHILSTEQTDELPEHAITPTYEDNVRPDNPYQASMRVYIVGESRNQVEYQGLNQLDQLVMEAEVSIQRGAVEGDIYWYMQPTEDEIDEVAQMIIEDFDPDEVDSFSFTMYHQDEQVARFHLMHEDLLDEETDVYFQPDQDLYIQVFEGEQNLFLELIRDDIDTVTFDIYQQQPDQEHKVGTTTIDLNRQEPTALVDLIEPRDQEFREELSCRILDVLDPEANYHSFTITMVYQDEVVDAYVFELAHEPEPVYS